MRGEGIGLSRLSYGMGKSKASGWVWWLIYFPLMIVGGLIVGAIGGIISALVRSSR